MRSKPWGPLDWLLPKLGICGPVVVGCLAAERRSIDVPRRLYREGASRVSLLHVQDEPSRYTEQTSRKLEENRGLLARVKLDEELTAALLAPDEKIVAAFDAMCSSAGQDFDLVLDISCFPKRFFFLMVKRAIRDRRIGTLVVAYTQPRTPGYASGRLAEDPDPVKPIPGFGPIRGESRTLVVGVGFETLGLPLLIDEFRDETRRIRVLMPFPPGQPYTRRIWRFLQRLDVEGIEKVVYRVNALDAFGSYAQIEDMVPKGEAMGPPTLAPYGPKPISLGMCLYAMKYQAQVVYTQPRVYNPDYTVGVGRAWGYCLKYAKRRTF